MPYIDFSDNPDENTFYIPVINKSDSYNTNLKIDDRVYTQTFYKYTPNPKEYGKIIAIEPHKDSTPSYLVEYYSGLRRWVSEYSRNIHLNK